MPYFLFIFLASAWAEKAPQQIVIREKSAQETTLQPDQLTDNEVQAVSSAVSAVLQTIMAPATPPSSIRGRCVYQGGFCPGALIELKDGKGQILDSQLLASVDGFVFSNLKPGRYNLEVSYPRYKLKSVHKQVSAGSEIIVEMIE
jgi:hypothetical protein